MGADPAETARSVERLRPLTEKPLIVKLTPNATDPGAVAVAAEEAGADAVSLINTLRGMALAPGTRRPWLGAGTGGVSGPAVRAVALAQVAEVAARVRVPVVGMGGVASGRDAADFLAAGAACVAVGTESFRDPAAGTRIGLNCGVILREERGLLPSVRPRERAPIAESACKRLQKGSSSPNQPRPQAEVKMNSRENLFEREAGPSTVCTIAPHVARRPVAHQASGGCGSRAIAYSAHGCAQARE